jgi:hypothetical protein
VPKYSFSYDFQFPIAGTTVAYLSADSAVPELYVDSVRVWGTTGAGTATVLAPICVEIGTVDIPAGSGTPSSSFNPQSGQYSGDSPALYPHVVQVLSWSVQPARPAVFARLGFQSDDGAVFRPKRKDRPLIRSLNSTNLSIYCVSGVSSQASSNPLFGWEIVLSTR